MLVGEKSFLGDDAASTASKPPLDASHESWVRYVRRSRTSALERLAAGASLDEVLEALVRSAEEGNPDLLCSILLLDTEAGCLRHGIAPSLPPFFIEAIDGQRVGPDAAACGAAAHTAQRVIVEDVMSHPSCAPYRSVAARAGIRACWSVPILDRDNTVLGTFASYYSEPRVPDEMDLEFIHGAAYLAGIAIEHKRTEEALRRSEARLRQVLDLVPHFVFAKDRDGRFLLANQAVADAYGTTLDDLIGRTDADFNPNPEEVRHFREDDLKVIESGEQKFIPEEVITDATGRERILQTTKLPYALSDTGADAILGIALDITEQRHAERALREAKERYRVLFDNAPEAVVVLDAETGRFADVNENAVRLFKLDRERLLTVGPAEISPPTQPDGRPSGDVAKEKVAAALAGEHQLFEWVHRDAQGQDIPCEIRLVRMPSAAGRPLVRGSVTDITARKDAEAERELLERQVQHAQKLESLGVLAGGIAHDFNNLLVGILGNASLALLELPPASPARGTIQSIETAAQRAADLAREMLAYSGKGRFVIEPIDLAALVQEMSHLLEASISKSIVLNYDFARSVPPIEGDSTQIRQVVMNLITNASDAIGERSGVIRIRTGLIEADESYLSATYLDDDLDPGPYVFIEVSDTGCGMDADIMDRIFDPFFTTKFTGRGLGLAAVLGIVRGHKGAIKVQSEPGRGSTIRVLLPLSERSLTKSTVSPATVATARGEPWRSSGTVLVIDDEATVRTLVRHVLERFGFDVITAKDGREGIDRFSRHYDEIVLVVLDMTMPHLSGEETFAELKRIKPDVRVILSSGYSEQEAMNRFSEEGLAGFLEKPYKAGAIIDAVRSVVETE